jgi:hypothetical protein
MRFEPFWEFWAREVEAPREAEQRAVDGWARAFVARQELRRVDWWLRKAGIKVTRGGGRHAER